MVVGEAFVEGVVVKEKPYLDPVSVSQYCTIKNAFSTTRREIAKKSSARAPRVEAGHRALKQLERKYPSHDSLSVALFSSRVLVPQNLKSAKTKDNDRSIILARDSHSK